MKYATVYAIKNDMSGETFVSIDEVDTMTPCVTYHGNTLSTSTITSFGGIQVLRFDSPREAFIFAAEFNLDVAKSLP